MPPDVGSSDVGSSSPNGKLERSYTAAKDRERLDFAKSGLQSEAAQGNIGVVLEKLLKLDSKVDREMFPRCISERYCDSIRTGTSGNRSGNAPATRRGALHIIIIIIVSSIDDPAGARSFLLSPFRVCRAFLSKDQCDGGDGRSNVVDKERSRSS